MNDDEMIYWPYAQSPEYMLEEKDIEIKQLRDLLVRIRDETVIDFDLYDEVCKLVGDGL